jgi:hypothetical protein
MRILDESKNFILYHDYESVYVKRNDSDNKIYIGDHYGDPKCGLIAHTETWFLAGGEGLTFFDFSRGSVELMRDAKLMFDINLGKIKARVDQPYFSIHSMKLENENAVRILVDPWSDVASTWLLKIKNLELEKLYDGPSLLGQPYQETIEF